MKTYKQFLSDLAARESGGKCNIENQYGYLGKYQMGEASLSDIGYYRNDGTIKNDWIGSWTSKSGVEGKSGFLGDCDSQDRAIDLYMKKQFSYIEKLKLDQYVGKDVGGVKVTQSGMLAGAHLVGVGKLKEFLASNGRVVPVDGNKVPITSYMKKFADYQIDFSGSSVASATKAKLKTIENVANSVPGLDFVSLSFPFLTSFTRFAFRIGGLPDGTFSVLGFTGEHHALSSDYRFTVELVAPSCIDPAAVVGKAAVLELSPGESPIHGIVASFASAGEVPDGRLHIAELASPLHPLSHGRGNRVFIGRSAPKILEEIARAAGLQVRSSLKESYPVREFTAQFDESDLDFLQRLAAAWGIFYRFEQGEDGATLFFHDTLEDLPRKSTPLLYQEESGAVRPEGTVFSLRTRAQLLPESVELRDYNYRTPETTLHACATPGGGAPGFGRESRYGENAKDLAETQRLARLRQQTLDGGRELFLAETDCRDLAPGEHVTVTSHPELDGSYLILGIEHRGDQRAAFAYGDEVKGPTYRNTLHLIRAGVPWRPALREKRRHHGTFTARIESPGGDYAHLDEQGRYRVRLDFDGGDASAAGASHPVRMMQPYGGRDYGLHLPLHAGTEVVVTCLGGELDRPVILGALPNPDTPTTVGAANHSQNIVRTRGGNEFLLDDRKGQEKVELFTAGRRNILTLDGDAQGHTVRLATEEGKMEVSAARTTLLSCGRTQTLQSGADHFVTVEKAQRLTTRQGEIAQQAATDIRMKAGAHILSQAEAQKVTLMSARDLNAEAGQSLSVAVRQNDLGLLTGEGRIAFQSAEKILLLGQGGGPIHLGQGEGAVEISTKGTVSLQSPRITLSAGKITVRSGAASNNSGAYGAGEKNVARSGEEKKREPVKEAIRAQGVGTKKDLNRVAAEKLKKPKKNNLVTSEAGLNFILEHEGFEPELYNDVADNCTIGVGHLLHKGPCSQLDKFKHSKSISRDDAILLLKQDVKVAENIVNDTCAVPLNQNQFDALVSFVFNVGSGNFQKSTLLKKLNSGNYGSVPEELKRWDKAGGKQINGLLKRRISEGKLFSGKAK